MGSRLLRTAVLWWFWPRCPLCDTRTANVEAHLHIDHCEPPGATA